MWTKLGDSLYRRDGVLRVVFSGLDEGIFVKKEALFLDIFYRKN
jgi:hypothetical protein